MPSSMPSCHSFTHSILVSFTRSFFFLKSYPRHSGPSHHRLWTRIRAKGDLTRQLFNNCPQLDSAWFFNFYLLSIQHVFSLSHRPRPFIDEICVIKSCWLLNFYYVPEHRKRLETISPRLIVLVDPNLTNLAHFYFLYRVMWIDAVDNESLTASAGISISTDHKKEIIKSNRKWRERWNRKMRKHDNVVRSTDPCGS